MTETAAIMVAIILATMMPAALYAGRIWERRKLVQDWRDQDKTWSDIAEFVVEVEKMRAELLGQHLVELPEPGRHSRPDYPGNTVPCLFHGSHQTTDPPCDPPEDTDFLATTGVLAKLSTQLQLDEFARWLTSWTPPDLPAPRRGSQASLDTGRKG